MTLSCLAVALGGFRGECGCPCFARDVQRRQRLHNPHRLQADGDDLADETDDVFGIIGAIRVVDDAAALVRQYLILIDEPTPAPSGCPAGIRKSRAECPSG